MNCNFPCVIYLKYTIYSGIRPLKSKNAIFPIWPIFTLLPFVLPKKNASSVQ